MANVDDFYIKQYAKKQSQFTFYLLCGKKY